MKYQKILHKIDNLNEEKIFYTKNSPLKCYSHSYPQKLLIVVNKNISIQNLLKKNKFCGYFDIIHKIIHIKKAENYLSDLSFLIFSTNSLCLLILLILLYPQKYY